MNQTLPGEQDTTGGGVCSAGRLLLRVTSDRNIVFKFLDVMARISLIHISRIRIADVGSLSQFIALNIVTTAAGDPQSRHTLAVNREQEFLHRTAVRNAAEGEAEIFATGISTS